ncbi:DUF975 family protein [Anaerorhabdus sp.]|uniref:DUF975 family protein n=1 Tax=Anaerorhabdus sp. TaxID=1872524 RepID=UPI002FCA4839
MERIELKARARAQMKPYLGIMIISALLLSVLYYMTDYVTNPFAYLFLFLVYGPLQIGFTWLTLDLVNGKRILFTDVFQGFNRYGRVVGFYFINSLMIFGWLLLFIVPGLIKIYSYSMAPYILKENPDMTILEAITKSRELMDGHKMDLFILELSFIGWILLSIITFGVVGLYVSPYLSVTIANFYRDLKPIDDPVVVDLEFDKVV